MSHYKRSYVLLKGLNQDDYPVKNYFQIIIQISLPFVMSVGQLKMFLILFHSLLSVPYYSRTGIGLTIKWTPKELSIIICYFSLAVTCDFTCYGRQIFLLFLCTKFNKITQDNSSIPFFFSCSYKKYQLNKCQKDVTQSASTKNPMTCLYSCGAIIILHYLYAR